MPMGVRFGEGLADLDDDSARILETEFSSASQARLQVFSVEKLHDDVRDVGRGGREIEDVDDMRTFDPCGQLGLAGEPSDARRVAREVRRHELHRNERFETAVLGQPHVAHAARAQQRKQLDVVGDPSAWDEMDLGSAVPRHEIEDVRIVTSISTSTESSAFVFESVSVFERPSVFKRSSTI